MRGLARAAALEGADVVRSSRAPGAGDAKGLPGDWVTEADLASERAMKAFLAEAAPDVPFQGEELGGDLEGLRWVVDPLDGTTNFVHGFWAVGVSIALVEDETPVAGAIAAPFMGDCWHAAAGPGGELGAARRRLGPVRGERTRPRAGDRGHRVPVPAQGAAAPLPRGDGTGARALRGPAPPRRGVPGPGLDRLRGVRRVLRARARGLGRRGGRAARARGGRGRHRLGRDGRVPVRGHPRGLARGARGAARRSPQAPSSTSTIGGPPASSMPRSIGFSTPAAMARAASSASTSPRSLR